MWFKNLIIYRLADTFALDEANLEEQLEKAIFHPCGRIELSRYGWVSPLGQGDALSHQGSGFTLLCGKKEERILPASVVNDFVNDRVRAIQEEEDRKVSRKERGQIKDDVILELTPKAFTRSALTYGLLMPEQKLLVVDAASDKKAEEFTEYLRKTLGSLPVTPLSFKQTPVSLMTLWLDGKESPPHDIELGDECELHDTSEEGGIVRCRQLDLMGEEIKIHLANGKVAVKLGLAWNERLSFVLADDFKVKKLKFSDDFKEQVADDGQGDKAAEFDAAFTLMSLEFARFLPRLFEIFGAEYE